MAVCLTQARFVGMNEARSGGLVLLGINEAGRVYSVSIIKFFFSLVEPTSISYSLGLMSEKT
jgi:hypothetical protein